MKKILDRLTSHFASLPSVGQRKASKMVTYLLENINTTALPINQLLESLITKVKKCELCWTLDFESPCQFCSGNRRNKKQLCLVENFSSLVQIENCCYYEGVYHILGGVLSAADNIGPQNLNIKNLETRIKEENFEEIIIAIPSSDSSVITIEYLINLIKDFGMNNITKISEGVPYGQKLDNTDQDIIITAINSRQKV